MALEKQTVSLNLGLGVDQKDDPKAGETTKFDAMQDFIWDKLKLIAKRFGQNKYPNDIINAPANPLAIGTTSLPSQVFAHENQLLMQNNGTLYSWFKDQDKWGFKGYYNPLEIDAENIISTEERIQEVDAATTSGVTVYLFTTLNADTQKYNVRYTAIEDSTGNYLADNVLLLANQTTQPGGPKVIAFASRLYVSYFKQGGTFFDIDIHEINLANGTASAASTLKTDMLVTAPGSYYVPNVLLFDTVVTNKAGVGERAFYVYFRDDGASGVTRVFAIDNTGAIDANIPELDLSLATQPRRGYTLYYNTVGDYLCLGYYAASAGRAYSLEFTSTTLTLNPVLSSPATSRGGYSVAIAADPLVPAQTVFIFEDLLLTTYKTTALDAITVNDGDLFSVVVSKTAQITGKTVIAKGLNIQARPIEDSVRDTFYLPCFHNSPLQATQFLIDYQRGKSDGGVYVAAKWNYGVYANSANLRISQSKAIATDKYLIPSTVKTEILTTLDNGIVLFNNGINKTVVDLTPEYAGSRSYLSRATHLSGGYMGYFDGSSFSEAGFFLDPELLDISVATTSRLTITVTQQGTASLPEVTAYAMVNGPLQPAGPAYYTFNTPGISWYIYNVINGVGIDPLLPGATAIPVNIDGGETVDAYKAKVAAAIIASGALVTVNNVLGTNNLIITNTANGSVTDATSSGFTNTGVIPAGTYLYSAVAEWIDVNGQVVRSAPVIQKSVTLSASSSVGVVARALPITNRPTENVRVQFYRSLISGTVLYNLTGSNYQGPKPWDNDVTSVGFLDNNLDAAIDANEILYTNGGVLPSYQIPACKHLSVFKNRIIASGMDSNTVYYSKTAINGEPVEFTAEGFFRLDNTDDAITGHAQLDDKLIVFKRRSIYYLSGDGANDLGVSITFSLPTLIAADVGCENHNSIQVMPLGLMFKSEKGIYLLDRGLNVQFIGFDVDDYNQSKVARAILLEDDKQVRFCLQDVNQALVYDYRINQWTIFSNHGGTDSTIWQNQYARVEADGSVQVENKALFVDADSTVETYNPTFQTHWLKIKNMQDYQRIYRLAILGELKSAHVLNYKIYYDYDLTNFDEYDFSSSNISGSQPGDSVYQPIIHLKRQKCDAIKIEITVEADGGTEECLTLTDMSFIVGVKKGLNKVKANKRL